ncbi:GDSL-type esterase/lipase family protein [uncultured Corynebacterium sp.]|uniref:GDSL-type esterase/lipase family protein n=1 Tax=uncultured Corynebacterium sp. TaxID=159447 RepID=UPI0025FFD8E5|nr:GDSL-type esterase/lipase family protein [uncultured Corynebacterium sp.]
MKKSKLAATTASLIAGTALAISMFPAQSAPLSSDDRQLPTFDFNRLTQADLNQDYDHQQPQPGNLVTFGDSIFANPTAGDAVFGIASRKIPDQTVAKTIRRADPNINPQGCAQGQPSIPKNLAADLGVPLNDYSCPGATVYHEGNSASPSSPGQQNGNTLATQVEHAIQDNTLNPDTRYVAIQGGYNDIYNNYLKPSGELPFDEQLAQATNQPTQKAAFAEAMDAVLNRIKEVAPNAQIKTIGYHTITEDTPSGWQCLYHLGEGTEANNKWDITYAFPVYWDTRGEINTNNWLREAADRHDGVEYVDTREFSKDHGECAAPEDRWVGGILIDTTTGEHNLALHLTDTGIDQVSGHIASNYQR